MLLLLAIVLVVLWAGGFAFLGSALGFIVHVLLLLAVISLILHFLGYGRGRSGTTL